MTPSQCRAARALIRLSQAQLAKSARVGLSTVIDFEGESREPRGDNLEKMRAALEKAGVLFIEENGEGAGVRLKKTTR
ncbi:helix-turn-helix transcriptional regulator [Bradyrhizobium sp. CIAT3101]|uniref:helix-turn-helix domain-containing protein n=1 Tax=Bradyrhizobium sp. CIAT3101 TaxID=439387 RepID=UPI0024B0BF68|nr:helix-turn-helix transcriptional regulator [Bradyrhizobium sp. CIAT3101]WFU84384.1 helix-turn-helix transcriptional regulator [Bradyrhizobium sp. CIAT3101]